MANLNTREFWAGSGERAVKTFAQTAGALLITGSVADASGVVDVSAIAWAGIASTAFVAALISLLTSISGDMGGKNGPSWVKSEGIGIANAEAEEALRAQRAGEVETADTRVTLTDEDDGIEAPDYDDFVVVDEAEETVEEYGGPSEDGDADEAEVVDATEEAVAYEPKH